MHHQGFSKGNSVAEYWSIPSITLLKLKLLGNHKVEHVCFHFGWKMETNRIKEAIYPSQYRNVSPHPHADSCRVWCGTPLTVGHMNIWA